MISIPSYLSFSAVFLYANQSAGFDRLLKWRDVLGRPPFHKPAAEVAAGNRRSPFKEQITLLSTDPDGITVSLATGLLRRGRADIYFRKVLFRSTGTRIL